VKNSDEILRNDDDVGMKWKQQFGQFRWAQANRLHLNSPKPIYLVREAKQLPGRRIHCHHIQCHTVSHVAVLAESMKFTGKNGDFFMGIIDRLDTA
jgi:glyoxylase-like metal-dependent hydrolase (beta-lactamase superfamily II)